jgi:prepilin-type processing-associated H-X9-DG protein
MKAFLSAVGEGRACLRERESRSKRRRLDEAAFTAVELVLVLALLAMLCIVALPVLANHQGRSKQLICLNNLSQVGRALSVWSADHRDRLPLMTPWWEGGSVPLRVPSPPSGGPPPAWLTAGLYNNAWFQFWWVSNELVTPKVLACPSDPDKRAAQDFGSSAAGGFLNSRFLNNAVSYTLNHPSPQDGRLLLSTDRSASYAPPLGATCSFGYTPNRTLTGPTQTWSDRLHPRSGNLLFNDGSVEQADERGLTEAASKRFNDDAGEPHYISP